VTPDEAPAGTVCVSGHPANGVSYTKQDDGRWRLNVPPFTYLDPHRDFDLIHKTLGAVYVPG
jgi:hypothetical protein